jgi:Protein of unknown function (DUF3570)
MWSGRELRAPQGRRRHSWGRRLALALAMALLIGSPARFAAVLDPDRLDAMYHYYEGDNTTVDGPALLVRKNFADKVSLVGSYYADTISSASIDVVTLASRFAEKRDEYGIGVEYLHRNTLLKFGVSRSEESDYESDNLGISLSQEMLGGMTKLTLGYGQEHDIVSKNGDPDFEDTVDRYSYALGLQQVLTKTMRMNIEYQAITDEGFLNSPYRAARVQGAFVPESYPRTRTSQAVALRLVKSLAPDKSLRFDYRYFTDTWGIKANSLAVTFNKYFGRRWLLELSYRYYEQSAASFYSDNFSTEQNFMARDKELSAFTDNSLGAKLTYTFLPGGGRRLGRGTLNLVFDHAQFDYDNFTDVRTGEPFSFDANVMQVFVSWWY